jgi:opacity protein-like surface antigen
VRKAVLAMSLIFLSSFVARAQTQPQTRIRILPDEERYFTVGLLGGFCFLQDQVFKELYGKSAPFIGGELTLRFPVREPHGVDIAVGGRTLSRMGRTSYTEEEIRLRLTDFSLALRYSYDTGRFAVFAGPGIEYVTYKETYAETFPIDSVDGNRTGFHLTGGLYVHLTSGLSIKAYFKYCRVKTDSPGFPVNLGGTEWGMGLLYRFYL